MPFALRMSSFSLALSLSLICADFSPAQSSSALPTVARSQAETELRAVVEKYFALYAGKDLDGLMSLWSQKSQYYASFKQNLRGQFATEGYSFGIPAISRVKVEGERASLRATVNLTAIDLKNNQKREQRIARNFSLIWEDGKWKVWRSAPAENDLAEALAKAKTEAERARLLAEEKELATAELARALIVQGSQFVDQGNFPQALTIFHLAQSIGEQIGARSVIGVALNGIGHVLHSQGAYTKALELYQESLAMLETEANNASFASLLNNIGRVHDAQGDYAQALEYYQKSLAVFEALDDKEGIAIVRGNIGMVYSSQGNLARALNYYQRSLAMSEAASDKLGIAITLGNIGAVHRKQGNYTQALNHYQKSLAMSESIDDKVGIAQILRNIGNVHRLQGAYSQAIESYQKSLAMSQDLGDQRGIASAMSAIGQVHVSQGAYSQALEYYQKSLAMMEAMRDKAGVARMLVNMGVYHNKQGRYSQALGLAERASTLAREIGAIEILRVARSAAGLAYRALNQSDQARQAFEEAIAIIETMRVQVAGGEREQQSFFEDKLPPYHAMVDLLVAQNNPVEALTFAERARARALLNLLYSGRVNIIKAMTGVEQEQDRKLRAELFSLNAQVTRASRRDKPDRARLEELKSLRDKARLNYEAFQTSLYAAHPELRVHRGEAPVIKAGEIVALLPDAGSALLEYVVMDETTYLFAVTKAGGAQVYTLPIKRDELIKQTESFRRQLAERNLGFRASARRLYQLLLKPARAQLRGKTKLVIAPDDKLWELPFQALLAEGDRYVIERRAISYVPSLTVLREMKAQREKRRTDAAPPALLALGNPDIGRETIERATLTLRDGKLDPLPEAEAEVKALGRLYGAARSKVYVGAEAREDRVKIEAGQAGILHFATHGTMNNASPMYSHLVLAQGDKNEDGLLEAWELMQMDLHADLAVLSACETARGRFGAGEGMIGLTWALFVAGMPSTVVSQWKVESASTRDLMLSFHRQLRAPSPAAKLKATKAEALRRAALKLMKNPATSHPFYWAGFVLVGDNR